MIHTPLKKISDYMLTAQLGLASLRLRRQFQLEKMSYFTMTLHISYSTEENCPPYL